MSDILPSTLLTEEEIMFCHHYHATGKKAGSYRKAFTKESNEAKDLDRKANTLLGQPEIISYLEFLKLPDEVKAAKVMNQSVLTGGAKEKLDAAKYILDQSISTEFVTATQKFWQIMSDAGAVVEAPVDEHTVASAPVKKFNPFNAK